MRIVYYLGNAGFAVVSDFAHGYCDETIELQAKKSTIILIHEVYANCEASPCVSALQLSGVETTLQRTHKRQFYSYTYVREAPRRSEPRPLARVM